MSAIFNQATERARRQTDLVLDAADQVRAELEHEPQNETSDRLRELADQLSSIGITLPAATAVMAEDFDQRLRALGNARKQPRCRTPADGALAPIQRSML